MSISTTGTAYGNTHAGKALSQPGKGSPGVRSVRAWQESWFSPFRKGFSKIGSVVRVGLKGTVSDVKLDLIIIIFHLSISRIFAM